MIWASQLTEPVPPQAEAPHAMPVFGFGKEWFDPDFPLVHGPLVGIRLVIPFHALLIVRKKRTVYVPTTLVGSTVGFQWAGITRASSRTVFHELCLLFSVSRKQQLPPLGSDTDHGQRNPVN